MTPNTLDRESKPLEEEAVLCCKAGQAALKANLYDKAVAKFRRALSINPMVWDAFEGLCAAGESDVPLLI